MKICNLQDAVALLKAKGELIVICDEVDPHLEAAAIARILFQKKGPAVLFQNLKNCHYPAVANLFGTKKRVQLLLGQYLKDVKALVKTKANPLYLVKEPMAIWPFLRGIFHAIPLPIFFPNFFKEIKISDLPQIQSWPLDGGAFLTLPQVYTEDPLKPGIFHSNLGMYRVQISGNAYIKDKEVGLHYQIHRGIGIHHTHALALGQKLKVSIFVGGHPAHFLSAVMPLPEGLPEIFFAGVLAGRNFRYFREDGYLISKDADFIILGEVDGTTKPEGPFGDHLGYYSLVHDFPVLRVKKVYAKKNAIYPFTTVGRPPQEDTLFGEIIHEISAPMVPKSLPGVHAVHAVDACGVHPLLLALGSERYTPYQKDKYPQEILTQALAILGFNQMSLAKYLFIMPKEDVPNLDIYNVKEFFMAFFSRMDFRRDLHFITRTTIDTLDYSGEGLNQGSKVILASAGKPRRELTAKIPKNMDLPTGFSSLTLVLPGIFCLKGPPFKNYEKSQKELKILDRHIKNQGGFPGSALLVLCEDPEFSSQSLANFLWVTFTRSNPSHDIWGVGGFIEHKHFGCEGPLIIDARIKPHHAPVLEEDPQVLGKMKRLAQKGKPLYGYL